MHKVAGETNPSDLFTKHLESQRKLDDLLRLFKCRMMDGRAASAPAMKLNPGNAKLVEEKHENGHVAVAHDPHVLPHEHLEEDIAKLFPRIEPEDMTHDEEDDEHDLNDPVPEMRRRERA